MGEVLGIDGCRAGWCCARMEHLDGDVLDLRVEVSKSLEPFLDPRPPKRTVAIDIPIGLRKAGDGVRTPERRCDQEARRRLGAGRGSSVFPTPSRDVVLFAAAHWKDKPDHGYAKTNAFSKMTDHKGLTQQSFHILRKIAEADQLMVPLRQQRVFEIHPEVCFWAVAGRPMAHSKRRSRGVAERQKVLASLLGKGRVERALVSVGREKAGRDDVLDALIAAWTARCSVLQAAASVPAHPEMDERGLRMEITFPRPSTP